MRQATGRNSRARGYGAAREEAMQPFKAEPVAKVPDVTKRRSSGALMWVMRWHVNVSTKKSWGAMDLWLGSAERLIAATLFALCVPALPAFIGRWITLKFAANWNRIKSEEDAVRKGALMAMIGSVASFTPAIIGGYLINPQAINCFIKQSGGSSCRTSRRSPWSPHRHIMSA